jgi:hypothetical protein
VTPVNPATVPVAQFIDATVISTLAIIATIASTWGSLRSCQKESAKKIDNIEKKLGIQNGAPAQFVTAEICDDHHSAFTDRIRRVEDSVSVQSEILQRVASIETIVEALREHSRRPRHNDAA